MKVIAIAIILPSVTAAGPAYPHCHTWSQAVARAARPRRQPEPPATLQAPVVDGPRGSTLLIPSIGDDAA